MRILICPIAIAANESSKQCPPEIATQQEIKDSYPDWNTLNEKTRYPLTAIRFSEGDPKNIVWLVPDKSEGNAQIWHLPVSSEGYWVSCSYNNTSIMLSRKLQSKIRQCRVDYDNDYKPPTAIRYVCE